VFCEAAHYLLSGRTVYSVRTHSVFCEAARCSVMSHIMFCETARCVL
jgi:hypothetical protein